MLEISFDFLGAWFPAHYKLKPSLSGSILGLLQRFRLIGNVLWFFRALIKPRQKAYIIGRRLASHRSLSSDRSQVAGRWSNGDGELDAGPAHPPELRQWHSSPAWPLMVYVGSADVRQPGFLSFPQTHGFLQRVFHTRHHLTIESLANTPPWGRGDWLGQSPFFWFFGGGGRNPWGGGWQMILSRVGP